MSKIVNNPEHVAVVRRDLTPVEQLDSVFFGVTDGRKRRCLLAVTSERLLQYKGGQAVIYVSGNLGSSVELVRSERLSNVQGVDCDDGAPSKTGFKIAKPLTVHLIDGSQLQFWCTDEDGATTQPCR